MPHQSQGHPTTPNRPGPGGDTRRTATDTGPGAESLPGPGTRGSASGVRETTGTSYPDGDVTRPGPGDGGERPSPAAESGITRTPSGGSGSGTEEPGGGARPTASGSGHPLLPHDDTDPLAARLHHAVAGFVDAPRDAVREADHVLQELAERFADAVTERRRTLRRSWQTGDGEHAAATDTEQLRLALRDYRELADRLLHV